MAAYVIAETDITDATQYEQYKAASPGAIQAGGGRFLVRGGELAVLEGDWQPSRLVVLEFEDLAAAATGMSQRSTSRPRSSATVPLACGWSRSKASTRSTPVLRPRAPDPRQEFVGGVSNQVRGVRSRGEGRPEEAAGRGGMG